MPIIAPAPTKPPRLTSPRLRLLTVLAASGVSMSGNAFSFLAIPWFVQSQTHNPAYTGIVSAATACGVMSAGMLVGPLLDRFGYRRMSILLDLAAAACIGAIPLLTLAMRVPIWALSVLVFLAAAAGMGSSTARQSMLPCLSADASVAPARVIAVYWTLQRGSLAFVALPAGLLITAVGPRNVLWIDAAAIVVAALLMASARAVAPAQESRQTAAAYLRDLRNGWSFMRREPLIRFVLGAALVLAAVDAPLLPVLLPIYAEGHDNPAMLGWLVSAYAGGALGGTLLYGAFAHRLPPRRLSLSCLGAIGLGYGVLWLQPGYASYLAALVFIGLASGPLTPLILGLVQGRTPSSLLGRVTGTLIAAILAATPVGRAAGGYIVSVTGGLSTILAGTAVAYLLVTGVLAASRRFGELGTSP